MKRPPRTALNSAFLRVRRVLYEIWNPVGASGLPADEYDSYVWPILRLLREGADAESLTDHLIGVEKHWFSRSSEGAQLAPVVAALLALDGIGADEEDKR